MGACSRRGTLSRRVAIDPLDSLRLIASELTARRERWLWDRHATILFLCPHNAAKSVLAAAYFDRLARERGLDYRAASAGTNPDDAPSPAVVAMLRDEGIDVAGHRPRRVTTEDLTSAHRVISLGCDPDDLDGGDVAGRALG